MIPRPEPVEGRAEQERKRVELELQKSTADAARAARIDRPPAYAELEERFRRVYLLHDAIAMLDEAIAATPAPDVYSSIERELTAIEDLQTKKVLDLARRLKPGLTLEDVQNAHDFPELDDPDWHYEDGILTGVKSVMTALRALKNRG